MSLPVFKTYEQILNEMIEDVNENSQLTDWNAGSPNRSMLEAVAAVIAGGYHTAELVMNERFLSTCSEETLVLYGIDMGHVRDPGEKASGQILCTRSTPAPFSELVPKGTVFQTLDMIVTLETLEDATLQEGSLSVGIPAKATAAGDAGNLQPFTELKQTGIAVSLLESIAVAPPGFTGGRDLEPVEQYRERLLTLARSPGTSANKAHYIQWAMEVPGVGGVYVESLWDGRGTVKVYLLDTEKMPASTELVQTVQERIDPHPHGVGDGEANVGATVTVVAAPEVLINITVTVVLEIGKTLTEVQASYIEAVKQHLKEIAFSKDTTIRWSKLGTLLSVTPGVIDYTDLLVNNDIANIPVSPGSVAVLGTAVLT
ncbi:baseplate J/gp47 family protein [Desulforamulus ruminis]|uniref:Baseplate J family protein n=1 Tax=Desulforamulus ruminis (strain ATCC 23193 / DSM 2154 / NCIMB 8452 / DL) TaxID=696281 RepID=F6DTE7_DESRL|nr:baseplate J/gp47 family protein [Desulforamulus ruminis]AEG60009.1 Baseplate J family protein [Desulforamulus ruminis DSM 2154]